MLEMPQDIPRLQTFQPTMFLVSNLVDKEKTSIILSTIKAGLRSFENFGGLFVLRLRMFFEPTLDNTH
jgi:hypothetical protein